MLNTKFRPTLQYYRCNETLDFYNSQIGKYNYPDFDYSYTKIYFKSNEIKVGLSFLPGDITLIPYTFNLNIGYKWINYGELGFSGTSFSVYTGGHDFSKYNKQGKIILSLSILLFSPS